MPRKAKDEINNELNTKTNNKKISSKSIETKKESTKKATNVKSTAKKSTSTSKKVSTKNTKPKSKTTATKNKIEVLEYYDLPYRYNKTIVKTLFQTPEILFVYWDISDEDKENYIKQYGEFFFNDTKPVLVIHNNTLNYSFEIDINDYANSWYLHITDTNCDYSIELGRRPINEYAKIDNFLSISNSNKINTPNNHILFDSLNKDVYFKNVRTNKIIEKDISLSFLTRLGKLYNVKEFYKTLYKDENIDFERLNLKNMPSS